MAREELDKYLTPDPATQALITVYPQICGGLLIDPCSGDGRMARALKSRFDRVLLNDIDPETPADLHLDACDDQVWVEPPCWVISNPPFYAAGEIVARALLSGPRCGVAMLLRATWGEPCAASSKAPRGDREWLADVPPDAVLFLPRLSFTDDGGTDTAPCYWYLWADDSLGIRNACVRLPRKKQRAQRKKQRAQLSFGGAA